MTARLNYSPLWFSILPLCWLLLGLLLLSGCSSPTPAANDARRSDNQSQPWFHPSANRPDRTA
ncbi:MAG TPA: hypothetical protein VGI75_04150 [Pirellulales bacterium]